MMMMIIIIIIIIIYLIANGLSPGGSGYNKNPRSGSQDHHPSKNSVQKTICCNSTSDAPEDGLMYPKHVELRMYQKNYLVASSWHFTLFH